LALAGSTSGWSSELDRHSIGQDGRPGIAQKLGAACFALFRLPISWAQIFITTIATSMNSSSRSGVTIQEAQKLLENASGRRSEMYGAGRRCAIEYVNHGRRR
jgi:hypothetical protein